MVTRAINNARRVALRLGHGIAHPEEELSRLQRLVVYGYDLAKHGWKQLVRDNAPLMAAALAYRTLFSAVPVMVLALVMARAFYGEEGIRKALNKLMDITGVSEISLVTQTDFGPAPTAPVSAEQQQIVVSQLLEQWINNAVTRMTSLNYGAITVISIGVFIYAAIILLVQVEESFNTVCQAARGRRLMNRLTTYWTLLTLGSLGAAGTVALGRLWADTIARLPDWASWAAGPIEWVGKLGIVWLFLLFAYARMPNTRVKLRLAAVGALVAAILWEVGKGLMIWFIRKTAAGQLEVYGSLALVPILLFWLYCTWHVVLFGLEVAWSIQTVGEARLRQRKGTECVTAIDPSAGVAVMQHLAAAFTRGESMGTDQISRASRLPEILVHQLLQKLGEAGMIHRVVKGADEDTWALARPPHAIGIDEILTVSMRLAPTGTGGPAEIAGPGLAVDDIRAAWLNAMKGRTLSAAPARVTSA